MTIVKTCNKPGCTEEVFSGAQRFACLKHHRLSRMRWNAKRRGLYCPTFDELESKLPPDMRCSHCNQEMQWAGEKVEVKDWFAEKEKLAERIEHVRQHHVKA